MVRSLKHIISVVVVGATLAAGTVAAQPKAGTKGGAAAAPAANQCIGKTKDGDQCKRKAQAGSKYCWQHDPTRKAKSKKS